MENIKDLFIIGGGINGTGIAADAAGRGLSVVLCEQNDLASGTSSASTKLIHGGLRYLELYEFSLVREALREREILMRKAPHLITPLKFILPHEKHLRPAWMIRLGLFLYDHLAKRIRIPGSKSLKLKGDILKKEFIKAFSYYDCITDDARLTISNAISARKNNAEILTQTHFISATIENTHWKIQLKNACNEEVNYFAKVLVNAAGPFVTNTNEKIKDHTQIETILDKGSHFVIPKLYSEDNAFILQNADGRIIFTIPYQNHFTLIGTTDKRVTQPEKTAVSDEEKNYLCQSINYYFQKNISPNDILWSYSGVRCLQQENVHKTSAITRDYKLLLTHIPYAPLLTVIGGKITTFRILAEEAVDKLKAFFPQMKPAWTADKPLPGGDIKDQNFELFFKTFKNNYPWLPEPIAYRYVKSYGTRANLILKNTQKISDLGENFGAGLYQKEIDYLIRYEWAKTIEDILWRRTKLGLFVQEIDLERMSRYLSVAMMN